MTAELGTAVLTARRTAQHIRLSESNDAYEHLCILTLTTKPRPVSALCWQIHPLLAVRVPPLRAWVHCPRASNGLLPRRSNLVGYVRWDERSNQSSFQTINSNSFTRSQPSRILSHLHTKRSAGDLSQSAKRVSCPFDGHHLGQVVLHSVIRISFPAWKPRDSYSRRPSSLACRITRSTSLVLHQ